MSREERGHIVGDVVIDEPTTLWGSIAGEVTVVNGGKFYNRGAIYGNLVVEHGGRVNVLGSVQKDIVIKRGAKLVLSGVVDGDVVNDGARLFVYATAKVNGRIITRNEGDTQYEKPPEDKRTEL